MEIIENWHPYFLQFHSETNVIQQRTQRSQH